MKKEWLLVVLVLGLAFALNGCCSCPKEAAATTGGMPSAYAAQAPDYQTQGGSSAGYSSQRAIK